MQIAVFAALWRLGIIERVRRLEIKLPKDLETRHRHFTPIALWVCKDRRQRGCARQ